MLTLDEQFAEKLKAIKKEYFDPPGGIDPEVGHIKVDAILIELLKELGYAQTIEIYESISDRFWYG